MHVTLFTPIQVKEYCVVQTTPGLTIENSPLIRDICLLIIYPKKQIRNI